MLTTGTFDAQNASRKAVRGLAVVLAVAGLVALAGCGALGSLNTAPLRPVLYDFGSPPGAAASIGVPGGSQRPVALADVDAPAALDTPAVLYRLAYADAQQPRPYAQARWSMAPAQLLRQRLREGLGQHRPVLQPGEGGRVRLMRVELEAFHQVFESPQRSAGLVRLRVTLTEPGAAGDDRVEQHSFAAQRPAPTPDAPGGVRALTAATDAVIADIDVWLAERR
ncbi:ABC-type transport auxiliary lipoprotein family protein [Caballeronia zhejiangensis]|uniref:ABC-type transport auxiliary lipoprotein family protein n=1 Tax=Caballeronia zhejiangensis TaxID=871203 RepID=UPI00052F0A14|nr:ABC-type transport auxiliary lipoprotein family protein [Caballeronia zhejiangensis]